MTTARSEPRWGTWGAVALVALSALVVYADALRNPFLLDDQFVILGDARVRDGDALGILTREYWPAGRGNRVYRPLTLWTFALNWTVAHEAWTFRLANVALHAASACAVFLLGRQLAGAVVGLVAGLVFAVHPVHTTPLNQVVDRADLGAAACVLWAAWIHCQGYHWAPRGTGERRRVSAARAAMGSGSHLWSRVTGVAGLFAVGLLFKENAVTLIGVLALLDVCGAQPSAAGGWRARAAHVVRVYVPLLAVLATYLALRGVVLGGVGRPGIEISPQDNVIARPQYALQPGESRFLARWGTPVAIVGHAARLLVWPHPLSWDYSYAAIPPTRSWTDARLWLGLMVLSASVAAMIASWRRRRRVCVAIGLVLVTYSVVSNTFVVIGAAFAERYLYLPSAGLCLFVGLLAGAALERARRAGDNSRRVGAASVWVAVGLVLFAGSAATLARNRDFRSPALLHATDVRAQPRSSRLWSAVALDALSAGRYADALRSAEQALTIFPEDPAAWRAAGLARWRLGEHDAALRCLEQSVALGGADSANTCLALGDILTARGDYARAIRTLEAFAAEHPNAATVLNNLAWYLLHAEPATLRDPHRALACAGRAVTLEPSAGDFLDTYVSALRALGRADEARRMLIERLPTIPTDDPQRGELLKKLDEP